jgi:hypothetical protein
MSHHLELIHTAENEPIHNMPCIPAIKVHSGAMLFIEVMGAYLGNPGATTWPVWQDRRTASRVVLMRWNVPCA